MGDTYHEAHMLVQAEIEQEAAQDDNRRKLAAILRDPSQWPEGFKWFFPDCATCSIGLFQAMGVFPDGDQDMGGDLDSWAQEHLGIDFYSQVKMSPFSIPYYEDKGLKAHDVQPEDVAKALEKWR